MHAFPVPAVLACATSAWLPYLVWQPAEAQLSLPPPPPVKGVPLTNWGRHQKIKKLIGGYVLTEL